jgi:tetratricopeptide (TPR) repeat protein
MEVAEQPASALELLMVRRSSLAEADGWYELGEYRTALGLFEHASEKYVDSAEGVSALYGVASCLHRLGERVQAIEEAKHARWAFDKLRKEKPEQVTRFLADSCNTMSAWSIAGMDF